MTLEVFIAGFLGASPIEIIASISGLLCVYLLIKRNIWCWFFGLIQVSLFTHVFFQAKLYSDAGLHVIYIFFQFYGWWNWKNNQNESSSLVIARGSLHEFILYGLFAMLASCSLGYVMANYTDASFAYLDAFTTCASLVAQFLLSRRIWFNWVFWIVVDIVAIYVYLQKGLYPTACLYFVLLLMCIFGLRAWLIEMNKQNKQLEEQTI